MAQSARFATTRWTLVRTADGSGSPEAAAALEALCSAYWAPVYAFMRRNSPDADVARDLTQALFTRLIEKRAFRGVTPEKGRFRSFLLASAKHFLVNEYERTSAIKRGGGFVFVPLDIDQFERRLYADHADTVNPETLYERHWALALLDRTLARLASECADQGQADRFARLKGYLTGDASERYAAAALELKMSEEAVRTAVHRLRGRYGELLRDEIAHTVECAEEVDEELRYLLGVLTTK